jgi:hypothetical protein
MSAFDKPLALRSWVIIEVVSESDGYSHAQTANETAWRLGP